MILIHHAGEAMRLNAMSMWPPLEEFASHKLTNQLEHWPCQPDTRLYLYLLSTLRITSPAQNYLLVNVGIPADISSQKVCSALTCVGKLSFS